AYDLDYIITHVLDLDFNSLYPSAFCGIYNKNNPYTGGKMYSPEEVQYNSDIEGAFIRIKEEELNDLKQKQKAEGLFNFKQSNVLMIHLALAKTAFSYMKRRRQFNEVAEFVEYRNGNVFDIKI
ncbi:MAG: hypothetical protein EZS28_021007, partial [Streblomastix strix]